MIKRLLGKIKSFRIKIFYTVLGVVLLFAVFASMIMYMYIDAEKEGYYNLHIQTKEIKEDIKLQMLSDQENLYTIVNLLQNCTSTDKVWNWF